MEIAKSELSELKKECVEAMEGQLKRHASLTNTSYFLNYSSNHLSSWI
jgi:hypothetical protein